MDLKYTLEKSWLGFDIRIQYCAFKLRTSYTFVHKKLEILSVLTFNIVALDIGGIVIVIRSLE